MTSEIDNLTSHLRSLNLSNEGDVGQARTLLGQTLLNRASYKPPKPQLVQGGRNALATRDWITEIERYCERARLPRNEWTSAAVDHLRSAAMTWFQCHRQLTESSSWDLFKEEVLKEFRASDHESTILMEL
ncbi:hypothetical protein BGZ51_001254, partial [Haplosporangium sp. Z 767]